MKHWGTFNIFELANTSEKQSAPEKYLYLAQANNKSLTSKVENVHYLPAFHFYATESHCFAKYQIPSTKYPTLDMSYIKIFPTTPLLS